MKKGEFFKYLQERNKYDNLMVSRMEECVTKLHKTSTTFEKPGMLLGKIQSGKTRTFIGIIGLAFDNDYDICILLTKSNVALTQQTKNRLDNEFHALIADQDRLEVHDIMNLNVRFTRFRLKKKLIIVVKKEDDNLDRLDNLFNTTNPELLEKRVLIVDDEADLASVSFTKDKNGTRFNVISKQIHAFRGSLKNPPAFLQVTATPYSLYLQPETYKITSDHFKPLKPAFTVLVPIHDTYVGSDAFFGEKTEDSENPEYYLFEAVDEKELEVLGKRDARYLSNVMTTPHLATFRRSIMNFIIGGTIRRMQSYKSSGRMHKYSFVMHTETSKVKHEWQYELVDSYKKSLEKMHSKKDPVLHDLIKEGYEDICLSLEKGGSTEIPLLPAVIEAVKTAITEEHLEVHSVNSDNDVKSLLGSDGQLNMQTPLTMYIGGQILDRGLTIDRMIGFFYGRNPKVMQQDTVLQHSRMYGARPREDLLVTRFYTSNRIHRNMKEMHVFDTALRDAFEKQSDQAEVIFIMKGKKEIIPCSPNKLLFSEIETIQPGRRRLPVGFQVKAKTHLLPITEKLDELIDSLPGNPNSKDAFLVPIKLLKPVIEAAAKSFEEFEPGMDWDPEGFYSTLKYFAEKSKSDSAKVFVLVRKGRKINRKKQFGHGTFEDSPASAKGSDSELVMAKAIAKSNPALILLRQEGEKIEKNGENIGWTGCPFWWPVLVAPSQTPPLVYSRAQGK
jgi:hypothetical protein